MQALHHGVKVAVFGTVVNLHLESTVRALFKIGLEQFKGLTFRMGGDVGVGDFDDRRGKARGSQHHDHQTGKGEQTKNPHDASMNKR